MLKLFSIVASILFFECSCFCYYEDKEPIYGPMADNIQGRTAKILVKRHNMVLCGTGGGYIDHVNMLALSFQVYRPLTIESAREIIVDCIEELLQQINGSEEIRPYLKEYPFTAKDVEIDIFSYTERGGQIFDPYIAVVSNCVHKTNEHIEQTFLWYCTETPENPYGYKNQIYEGYQKALQIVKEGKEKEKYLNPYSSPAPF